jgi:hypothetical protein
VVEDICGIVGFGVRPPVPDLIRESGVLRNDEKGYFQLVAMPLVSY